MINSKKILTLVLAVVMLLQSFGLTGFAADVSVYKDFPTGSWSEEAMTAAVDNGLLVGTSDTTIEPRKNLTRAEFAAIVTRAFGATEKADISNFKDVDAGKWYADPIAKVVQMGVMNGTGSTTFTPDAFMKREDVILALARVLFVNGDDVSVLDQFSDRNEIDTWSVKAIAGMISEGYVNGYEDGTIRPRNLITRQELAQLFHNIFKTYISADGEFDSVAKKGSVIVRSKYVTLKDVTIDGDLVMADGIGGGDFRISNVHVTGKIIARGGEGMNYFVNVTTDGKVIVNDPNGVVNFYNYREEDTPFKGGNVIENTPATFLERKSVPTSPSMGGGATYKLTFKDVDGNDVKTVSKTNKNYVITDGDVPTDAQMAEDGYIFKGWSTDKNATSGESRDYFIDKKIGDVKGTWYPIYVEGYEVVFYADDTVGSPVKTETGVVEASYVIKDSDVPADADMEKAGFEFQGWSQMGSVEVKNRTFFFGKNASEVKGEWYPVYVTLTVYKVSFKYNDGTDALAVVEKTLKPSEDYVLTNADVKDVAHPTAPADYNFIGWSETANDTTNVVTSAALQVSIKDLDGKTFYAQFEKVTDNYTVVFKYTDGTEISRVEKTLSDSENYVLTNADVKDVDYHTNPADYTFLGWTDTVSGTDYKTSAELRVSIKDLDGKTYYAQYERNETTYSVSFKYNDGTEALPTVEKNLVASEDYVLTNADVKDVAHPTAPADYKFIGWSETANDTTNVVSSADLEDSIKDLNGKTFYAQFEKVTDNYTVVFKYTDGTEINKVEKTLSASEDYTLSASDVDDVDYHTNPADYTFLGWTDTVAGTDYKTSAELQTSIKTLDGKTYYAQYERNETTYSVSFKYNDGTEALPTVEKNLVASEDYVLTNADVKDVAHPTSPADYKFIGWSETANDTTNLVASADLEDSIKGLDGKTFYAQFEKVTDNYTVVFKYTDGTEINKVEKTLSASEDYTLSASDVADVDYHTNPADYTFLGWTDTVAGTDYKTSAELQTSIKTLDGKTYYAQYERNETTYSVSFKYNDGTEALPTVEKNLVASEDYVLTNADVKDVAHPTSPADYKFIGWSETANDTTNLVASADLEDSIKDLNGKTFYAQFERNETTYSVSFKYDDGTEALPTVEKNLIASEDYVLTSADVKDVPHPTAPAEYKFIGWSEAGSTVVFTNAELQVSIRDLDGKTFYAQFEEIKAVYTIIFKDNDENELVTLTKDEDESIIDSEIPAVTVDASSVFKGWTTTKGSTTVEYDNTYLASDVVENIFLSTTVVTLYPVIVDKDAVEYFVEHYFEDLDGNYVLDASKTQSGFEIPGKTVTATALTVEHYEENLAHAERLETGIVPDAPAVLTLKFFYDLEVIKVNYYDLAIEDDASTPENDKLVKVFDVKYGGTIDNFCYEDTAFDAADNDAIKAEIAEYVEYLKMAGYGKDYNDKYFYPLFEDKLGGIYEPMYPRFNFPYEHAINFKWYLEDDVEDFVAFEDTYVFTEETNLYSKVKKLNVEFILPEKLSGGMPLIINVPYEESTRFLDSVRDALFINNNIATYPDTTGLEDKFYEKMSNVGGKVFGEDGVFNSNNEINNTDIFVYFYQLMGGKSEYQRWLWNEVEHSLADTLSSSPDVEQAYWNLRNTVANTDELALKMFFEDDYCGLDIEVNYVVAYNKYIDSKKFIDMSSNEDQFLVTVNNEFIMEKVEEKIESLASVDSVITEYGGGRVPEGLLDRLPMDIIEDVYEPRVQRFLTQLDDARAAAANNEPEENRMVDSGIYFDVNLVDEILVPGMEFAKESHEKAVNKAITSGNKGAKLVKKYYVDNPYVTGEAGNFGVVNYAFEPSFYVTKTGNVDANGYSMYKINRFEDIYKEMVMPESVETIDALLWYMDPDGGAVDFANIRKFAEDNEDLILALHNHPNALMADYAVNGLPENMEEYWEDLLSDPEIKKAVEKLDNNVSFDMMFFVESKIQNATLEMYYLKVLDKAGVPVENILSKYTNSKAYKELTSADFNKLLDQLEECWETVDIDGKPVVNANGTTDYVFDNVLEKVGSSGDVAQASIKGFEVKITRFFADDLFQNAPEND